MGDLIKTSKSTSDSFVPFDQEVSITTNDEKCFTCSKGSLTSSILTLTSMFLGVGVLGLPHTFVAAGLGLGAIFLLLGGIVAIWSLQILVRSSNHLKISNYSDLVTHVLGSRIGNFFNWIYIIYLVGVMTNFQITRSTFVQALAPLLGFQVNRTYEILIAASIIYPLACAKSLSNLRNLSIIIVAIVLYTCLLVIIEFFLSVENIQRDPNSHFDLACWDFTAFTAFSVALLAYNCSAYVLNVQAELNNSSERRMSKVCKISIFVVVLLYLSIAIFGYLPEYSNTPALITERKPLLGSDDSKMIAAKALFAVLLIFATALRGNPCRTQIYLAMGWCEQDNTLRRCLVTLLIVSISAGLAIILPDIYSAFSIVGGTVGTLLLVTFPGIIDWKLFKHETWLHKIKTLLVTTICSVFGMSGAIATLLSLLRDYKQES